MGDEKILRALAKWIDPYRVTSKKFRLRDFDPGDTAGLRDEHKPLAQQQLADGVRWLTEEQDMLFAQNRHSLLLIFQAMDAAGKDSVIKHVMGGVNPQGVQVTSFKQPTAEELDHDFLWRCWKNLPERGRIGIFNRSYYEEVLVVRVHRDILESQRLPPELVTSRIFDQRLRDIAAFEDYLVRNGTTVLKFFLNVSPKEQKKRFLERIEEPSKNWKFSLTDVKERERWNHYMKAYEQAIQATATHDSPWFVVPADNKWFARLVVVAAVDEALAKMKLGYPKVTKEQRADLEEARRMLAREK